MKEITAKYLDIILKELKNDTSSTISNFDKILNQNLNLNLSREELWDFHDILNNDGYIKSLGYKGINEAMPLAMIEVAGRAFIIKGGYSFQLEEELELAESEKLEIEKIISEEKNSKSKSKFTLKIISLFVTFILSNTDAFINLIASILNKIF